MYGGKEKSFNNETKTRYFINLILEFIYDLVKEPSLELDMEVHIKAWQRGSFRPDCQFTRNYSSPGLRLPVVTFEVKKLKKRLTDADVIKQHMEQLRGICVKFKLSEAYGVLTNLQCWHFTRYSMTAEVQTHLGNCYNAPFEMS